MVRPTFRVWTCWRFQGPDSYRSLAHLDTPWGRLRKRIRNQPSLIGREMQERPHEKAWDVCPQAVVLVPGSISMPNIDPHIPSWSREGDRQFTHRAHYPTRSIPGFLPSSVSSSSSRSPGAHPRPARKTDSRKHLPPPSLRGVHPFVAIGSQRSRVERAVGCRRLVSGVKSERKRTKGPMTGQRGPIRASRDSRNGVWSH